MKKLFVLIVSAFLNACQSVSFPVGNVSEVNQQYPPVSINFLEIGSTYGGRLHGVDNSIYIEITKSDLFQSVTVNNPYVPFRVYVSFADKDDSSDLLQIAKGLLSGLSLFTIPVTKDYKYEATFDLVVFDRKIKTYTYEVYESGWIHLFAKMPGEVQELAAQSMTSRFLEDLSRDGLIFDRSAEKESFFGEVNEI